MAITSIGRYFVGDPNIVCIITTDNLATITTTGYLTAQQANIDALQNGEFEWTDTDLILMYYSPATLGFFTRDAANQTFDELDPTSGLSNTLQDGDIFVGNASNVATGVTPSGDIAISNTGQTTIQANAVTTAKILNANVTLAKLAAGITPSHIVKFASQVTTTGGATAEAITVTGAAATDLAFVQLVNPGSNTVSVVQAVVTLNTLTVTFSADPGNDAVINYQLLRAAS